MKLYNILISIFTLFALASALADQDAGDSDDKKKKTTTVVWVTITTKGKLATVSTAYSQSFAQTYSSATAAVKSGGIGMGSISGKVGEVRSYEQTTIKQANGAGEVIRRENVYGGLFGCMVLLAGALL